MIMLHVITNQRVYSRLQAEIDTAYKKGKISRPVVDNEESLALPYLQAVIKESLRIFPPGTGLGSKIVPQGGDYADDIFLHEERRLEFACGVFSGIRRYLVRTPMFSVLKGGLISALSKR
jgi:hypothetical protein